MAERTRFSGDRLWWFCHLSLSSVDLLGQVGDVEAPLLLLLEVVGEEGAAVELDAGRIEGVLGDGGEDAVRLAADEEAEGAVDAGGGAVGHEYGVGVGRIAVAGLYALGDVLAEDESALGVGVGPCGATHSFEVALGAIDDVAGEVGTWDI